MLSKKSINDYVMIDISMPVNQRYEGIDDAIKMVSNLPTRKLKDSYLSCPDVKRKDGLLQYEQCAVSLKKHANSCGPSAKEICLSWAGDCYAAIAHYHEALRTYPALPLGSRASSAASRILNIKFELNEDVSAREILTIFGPKLTKFGRLNITAIETYIDAALDGIKQREKRYIVGEWVADAYEVPDGYSLFNGHPSYITSKPPRGFVFSQSETAENFCVDLIRAAENTYREDKGLPKIGEGWIAETALFYAIKEQFPSLEVHQHASPEWLGRQHFDVYLPEVAVALEYQGLQHDQPVDYFGGLEAFQKTILRDKKKMLLAKKNNVLLIYVREGYCLDEILGQILERVNRM